VETRDYSRIGGQPEDAAQMVPAPEVELWFVREVLPLEASLMRFLRSSFRNAGELADLRQDIYAELIEAAKREIPASAKSFLFTLARHTMIDRMRRLRVVPMDTISDLEKLGLASEAPSADRVVIAREELRHLRAAIDRLPPRYRETVVMARIDGLSGREIALRLNLDESTVSHYIKKGLQLLADTLYGELPGELA